MAADAFVCFVKNLPGDFKSVDVEDFFKSYFSTTTPIKMKMKYRDNIQDSIKHARNCIITNLYLNKFFQKKAYALTYIEPICTLLLDTKEIANDNQQAQIIFLLHLSKAELDRTKFVYFENFFRKINTIQLTTSDFQFKDECNTLFNSLKNNKIIKKIIRKVVKDISGKETTLDLDLFQVAYFDSHIDGLNGFAGLDKIYISRTEQQNLHLLSENYSENEKLLISKLNFTRLVLHEITHIILRKSLNDFNISSPKLFEATNHTYSTKTSIEAGIFAENELFNARINWKKSATSSKLNIAYCSSFMDNLMKDQEDNFNIELAAVELIHSQATIMAVDYDYDYEPDLVYE